MPKMTNYEKDVFWAKVERGDNDKCWSWRLVVESNGYANVMFKKKKYKAHRIAYFLHYGVEPGDKLCCHKCDNSRCLNPMHIFLGTYLDNSNDKVAKGRQAFNQGEKNGYSKLNKTQVNEIRRLYELKISASVISNTYGIKYSSVKRAVVYESWKHIKYDPKKLDSDDVLLKKLKIPTTRTRTIYQKKHTKISDEDVISIRKDGAIGGKIIDIASKYGCSESAISLILKNKRRVTV